MTDGPTLTHWGRVTHICVGKTTIIGSDNGLSPGRRQAIIWTNAGILLIGTLGINFREIWIECHSFPVKKMHVKMSSGKWRPSCLGLNVLISIPCTRTSMYLWPCHLRTRIRPSVWCNLNRDSSMKIQCRQWRMFQKRWPLAHWRQRRWCIKVSLWHRTGLREWYPAAIRRRWWYAMSGDDQYDELAGLLTWDFTETY